MFSRFGSSRAEAEIAFEERVGREVLERVHRQRVWDERQRMRKRSERAQGIAAQARHTRDARKEALTLAIQAGFGGSSSDTLMAAAEHIRLYLKNRTVNKPPSK